MKELRTSADLVLCPECKGRGMIRPPGEWHNETCPTCDGRGEVARDPGAIAENLTAHSGVRA